MRRPGSNHLRQNFDEARTDIKIRPLRKRESKHPAPYSIRFDDEERARLNRDAKGKSWAAHIRSRLFPDVDQPPQRRTRERQKPELNEAKIAQVLGLLGQSRLTSHLNQIAKAVHLGALPVTPELEQELAEACAEIRAMRQALMQALGLIRVED